MALSTTTNYSLRKHDAGDLNWDVDVNWNMTEIDKKLKLLFANFLTCSTAIGTAAKTAAFSNFVLETGCLIAVKFTNGNSASEPTLDVNSTGAKAIQVNGAAIPTNAIVANGVYLLAYDGTNWALMNPVATLPTIATGDAGKFLKVNSTEDGTEWSASSSSDALSAPYELVQVLGSLTTNTTIDCADGNIATCTIGGALSFTFTASCASGYCRTLTLIITNGGAYTITWPASVKWAGGTAPTSTASGLDIVTLVTVDAGTTWYGSANGVSYA